MIDPDKLLGATLPERTFGWDQRDVILYALGLGVGDAGIGERDLRRVYEKDLEVLPTFAALGGMVDVDELVDLPGAGFATSAVLHGSTEVTLHRAPPSSGRGAVRTGSVEGVHDKGTNAIMAIVTETSLDGVPLATTRGSIFVRGEGGFGGSQGAPAPAATAVPDRAPDAVVDVPVRINQAALYRLSGDWNDLHIDPAVAAAVGFPTPILHGMCSFGIAVTATIDQALGGDVSAVRGFRTRFAGVALPGDVLRIRTWSTPEGAAFDVVAATRDDAPVLAAGAVLTKESI